MCRTRLFSFLFSVLVAVGCQKSQEAVKAPEELPPPPPPVALTPPEPPVPGTTIFAADRVSKPTANSYSVRLRWPTLSSTPDTLRIWRMVDGKSEMIAEIAGTRTTYKDESSFTANKKYEYRLVRIDDSTATDIGATTVSIPFDLEVFSVLRVDKDLADRLTPDSRVFLRSGSVLRTDGTFYSLRFKELHSDGGIIEAYDPNLAAAQGSPVIGLGKHLKPSNGAHGRAAGEFALHVREAFGRVTFRFRGQDGGKGGHGAAGVTGRKGARGHHAWLQFRKKYWDMIQADDAPKRLHELELDSADRLRVARYMPDLSRESLGSYADDRNRIYPDRAMDLFTKKIGSSPSTNQWFLKRFLACDTPPGHGGVGEAGDAGGTGGAGGNGGAGGRLFLAIRNYDTMNPEHLNYQVQVEGGSGGLPGDGGFGGKGGPGGEAGQNEHDLCPAASAGPEGIAGPAGPAGISGNSGPLGAVCTVIGTKKDGDCSGFDKELNALATGTP